MIAPLVDACPPRCLAPRRLPSEGRAARLEPGVRVPFSRVSAVFLDKCEQGQRMTELFLQGEAPGEGGGGGRGDRV